MLEDPEEDVDAADVCRHLFPSTFGSGFRMGHSKAEDGQEWT